MIEQALTDGSWLPFTFAFLMGLSMLIYAVLDGYDLGVGMLIDSAHWHEKDRMIASIGPFWDANETWLILGVGLLLVAFPLAHGLILTELYLPVAVMLFGLIFRGVAFDFRARYPTNINGVGITASFMDLCLHPWRKVTCLGLILQDLRMIGQGLRFHVSSPLS